MPALPLTPAQLADASRLKALYDEWKADRRARGESASQEVVAGQVMSIRYPHGGVGIVDGGAGHQVEKGTQLEHDRAKGHDLER